MAKIQRILRKQTIPTRAAFDEQLWPVLLALCVLAGFTLGSILAYLRFDDPRWYSNAATWLALTVFLTISLAVALASIENRVFRRSMQLAIVLCLLFHALMLVVSLELRLFDRVQQLLATSSDLSERREPVTLPVYYETPRPDQLRRDLERPVELETPAPERELDVPREPSPTAVSELPLPAEAVPEVATSTRPAPLRRARTEATRPRHSEQAAQLSRRRTQQQPEAPSTRADELSETPAEEPRELTASEHALTRREMPTQLPRREPVAEPALTESAAEFQLARRAESATPEVRESAAPTFSRQTAPPVRVPRTAVDLDAAAAAAQTESAPLEPQTTLTRRQLAATPEPDTPAAVPVPEARVPEPRLSQPRQLRPEPRQELAQTPVDMPTRQPRTTPRPDAVTAAEEPAASAPPEPALQERIQPTSTALARAAGETSVPREPVTRPADSATDRAATPPAAARAQAQLRPLAAEPESLPPPRPSATRPPAAAPTAETLAAASPAAETAPTEPASQLPAPAQAAIAAQQPSSAQAVSTPRPPSVEPAEATPERPTVPSLARARAETAAQAADATPATRPLPATATSPQPAVDAVAEAQLPTATAPETAAETPAARELTPARQQASPPTTARVAQADSADASQQPAVSSPADVARTRLPRGEPAEQLAQSESSAPARRQTPAALPAATTVPVELADQPAAAEAGQDQPRPSTAAIARQPVPQPAAERSQPAREAPAAAHRAQIARPTPARTAAPSRPSALPDATAPQPPVRAALTSQLPASPAAVESPALAETTRDAGQPAASPARTAMSRALTGTAGIGSGRNLDRARPAADSPAMVASAAARRAAAQQDTPPGPDLAPSSPALQRRALADQSRPAASLRAEPTAALATAPGAEQPAELAASASAIVRQAAADAEPAALAAARGTTAVDLGPTQIVSEGQIGRASGGGQPVRNPETDAPDLARSDRVGGAPQARVQAETLVPTAMAPDSEGGGQPPTPETEMPATAVARTDPGGQDALAGGPAWAERSGEPSEVSRAAQPSERALTRAELAEAVPDPAAPGGGEEEDEEERRRRLARAAARQAALDTPLTAELPAIPGESAEPAEELLADATAAIGRRAPAAPASQPREAEPAVAAAGGVTARASEATPRRAGTRAAQPDPAAEGTTPPRARSDRPAPGLDTERIAATAQAADVGEPIAEAAGGGEPVAAAVATPREAPPASGPAAAELATRVPELPVASMADAGPRPRADARSDARGDTGVPQDEAPAGLARSTGTASPRPDTALAAAAVPGSDDPAREAVPAPDAQLAAAPLATGPRAAHESAAQPTRPIQEAGQQVGGSGPSATDLPRRRAEAVEAALGSPVPGGGTLQPARAAQGPALAVDTRADTVQLAASPESAGVPDSSPLAAQGVQPGRRTGGVPAPPESGPAGALAADETWDVTALANPGSGSATRSASPSTLPGPASDDLAVAGPLERADRSSLPPGAIHAQMIELPDTRGDAAVGQATIDHNLAALARTEAVRRQAAEGGLTVRANAPDGPGGLDRLPAADVGIPHRQASRDSVHVAARTTRFARRDVGGQPEARTAALLAAPPFQHRAERGEPGGSPAGAPPPVTEEAIERGLAFLARQQLPDGSWSFQGVDQASAVLVSDTAATALALLAFQGAGYHHRDFQYADRVAAGLRHLKEHQRENGDLFIPLDDESNRSVWIYSHSLAALALTEAYGMTQDPDLRAPAQRAVDFLLQAQHPERGGWRYSPATGSDTSVTGWAMMALKSGELANLEVPEEAYKKIRNWLQASQDSTEQPHLYRYNPFAPDTPEQRHGRKPSLSMTSVGLLMRLYLGWDRDQPDMQRGADYLAENLPQLGTSRQPLRDTYYWYYATQVMFHMGGDYWQQWNEELHPLLVDSQVRQGALAGSWDPRQPIPDRWAPHAGRLYVTTMNLLSLEVTYRYLPLYDDTAR